MKKLALAYVATGCVVVPVTMRLGTFTPYLYRHIVQGVVLWPGLVAAPIIGLFREEDE